MVLYNLLCNLQHYLYFYSENVLIYLDAREIIKEINMEWSSLEKTWKILWEATKQEKPQAKLKEDTAKKGMLKVMIFTKTHMASF